MGEEVKQQEQPPAEAKPEEKPAEEKKEENPPPLPPPAEEEKKEEAPPPPPPPPPPAEEEKKPEEPPPPPPPCVLFVDLHCVGCAKKIERTVMKMRGVERVVINMAQNQVTIKGVVEPQAICNMIMKKIKRSAKVLSPLPAHEGEPIPEVVTSQVSGLTTVELNVNMHCEACAEQLKKKILKMRGVQTAETELSSGKVTVTGTMDADKLVDYVYRRTKKQARIVPQPEPEKPPEEPKSEEPKEPEKPADEPKPEEKKEEGGEPQEGSENPPEEPPSEGKPQEGENKEENNGGMIMNNYNHHLPYNNYNYMEEEPMKRMMYSNYNPHYNPNYNPHYSNYHNYQPLYVVERIPPPQLFSDENPNACSIS